MQQHFSLDIETLDTEDTAVVLSVGVCAFDEKDIADNKLHLSFLIDEQILAGRTISSATFYWWAKVLAEKMTTTPFPEEPVSVWSGMIALNHFFAKHSIGYHYDDGSAPIPKDPVVWCRGQDFDWTIIKQLYKMVKLTSPIKFCNVRDQRTFCKQISNPKISSDAVLHDGCSDAVAQAKHIQQVLQKYKLKLL